MLHPESLMNFIVEIETQQFAIAETDGFRFVAVNKIPDEL